MINGYNTITTVMVIVVFGVDNDGLRTMILYDF